MPTLKKIAASAPDQTTRLHALWTLDGLDSLDAGLVSKALADPSRDVRVSAIRLAERWLSEPASTLQSAVLKLETDPDWAVRRQLAATLGALPSGIRETAIAGLLARHGNDPITVDAALSGVRGSETMLLGLLVKSAAETPQLAESIAMTAATIVRGAEDGPVQDVFTLLAQNERPLWQRSALMRGAESALLPAGGGAGPWRPRSRRRAGRGAGTGAPAPAGARGGPGSSPAFARAAAEPRNQGGVTAMPLRSEPALVKVARETGDLGTAGDGAACAPDVARQAKRRAGRGASDRRRAAAVRCRPRGVSDALRRVPSSPTAAAASSWPPASSAPNSRSGPPASPPALSSAARKDRRA